STPACRCFAPSNGPTAIGSAQTHNSSPLSSREGSAGSRATACFATTQTEGGNRNEREWHMVIRVEVTDTAAHVIIDRPATRNALDRETSEALAAALDDLRSHDVPVVFRSSAPGMFVSGADITELAKRTRDDALEQLNHRLFLAI